MQLEYKPVVSRLPNGRVIQTFDVLCDGVIVSNAPTRSVAIERMDRLWEKRPEADLERERQYLSSIGEI